MHGARARVCTLGALVSSFSGCAMVIVVSVPLSCLVSGMLQQFIH